MQKKTNREIAKSWDLWQEYINPDGTMTRDEFDAMSVDERVDFIVDCFGEDETMQENTIGYIACDATDGDRLSDHTGDDCYRPAIIRDTYSLAMADRTDERPNVRRVGSDGYLYVD
jgi:hypothetical protein